MKELRILIAIIFICATIKYISDDMWSAAIVTSGISYLMLRKWKGT